jgi:hypothetical protein
MRPALALASLLGAATVGVGWLTLSKLGGTPFLGIEAIYPALAAGFAPLVADRAWRRAPRAAD